MANFKANSLIVLFSATGLAMLGTHVYTLFITTSRHKTISPWLVTIWVDYLINFTVFSTWIYYKESTWRRYIVWVLFIGVFGNLVLSFYILKQLLKLSPQQAREDPIYHVLLRDSNNNNVEPVKKPSLATTKAIFGALGCVMLGLLIYTLLTDGSPFRKELLDPWMVATLVEFYCFVIALSVWVAYKESSLICAAFWILLLICFGSIATCGYVVVKLFQLTSEDPLYLVLVKHVDRQLPN